MMMVELQKQTYLQYKRVSTDALACEGSRCHRDSDSRLKDIEGPPRYVYDILLLSIHTASVQALNIIRVPPHKVRTVGWAQALRNVLKNR